MDKDKRRKKKRRKKSKSGFTLIEIIGVIIIIGIIAIITVPAISKYVNNSKEKTYITYEENMKVATENKVVECISGNDKGCYLPESGEKKIVYLNELVESGYMDSLKDPENDGFCSNELSYVEVTNTNGANYEYKACLYCGNYTTEDAICTEYEFDAEKPVCGTVEGESTKWTNSNRTIIVGCSDSSSGCRSTTFSKTFTETTKNGEVTIVDRSGNTTNCPVEVYVDKTMPKCTLEIVGGTQEATGWLSGDVSVKLVSWSDSDSGVLTYGIGTSINNRNYNKQTSIKVNNGLTTVIGYVKDYAGNEGTCAVDVRVGAPKPEFDIEYGYQIYPSKEAYTLVNMTESGTKLTSTTTDPQISFTELNDYKEITRVRVRFNTAIPATTTAQLFYSNGTHTEANSVKALLVQGQKIVEFVVPKGSYKNLRLDLGSLNNTTFDIEKIEVMVGDRSTLFTNKNVSVNLIPKNETVRTTNYSFDNGATWQDINYKDYSDNITGSAKTKNIATLISDPAKTYKIENIDKGVPKVTITVTEKTNEAEVESNVWVDDNLNFKLVSSKVGSSGATIYYCKDTNNTCNPTTKAASGTMVTALNTTEGIYYIRYKVVSGAGTSSEISSFTAKVDKTKPTITSVTGNATSWTNQDVTLVINGAKDGESKLPDKPYSFNGGETWQATNSKIYTANTNNIVIKVRDIAGNVYTHTAINITKIDKEKPSCELKVTSGSQVNGYYYTDVTVGFAKTTDTGGSEVKEYGIGDFTTKTVTLNEDKNVTYTANIRDNAGNTNTCTITVRRQNTFTLTYNSNGGNICSPSSRDISYGSKYGALCSPTRAGYSFAGWYTEATGGTKITADTTVTATENQTLYAHWTKCDVGTYNTGNKSTCTACPTGYTSAEGSTAENQCYITIADGKYLGTAKSTTQTACPAGQFKASHTIYYGNTSSCSTCAAGTFSTGGAKTCTACPTGYTSAEGATAQNKCYINVSAGKYIATANSATQTACPAGTAGLTHTVYYGSTSSCTKCAIGTYSTGGAAICTVCPSGYTSAEGATAQNKCYINVDAGSYIKTANSATPVKCAAGTAKGNHTVYYGSTSSCVTCTAGKYSLEGAGSCSSCPTGYTSAAGTTAQNKCYITVADGKYLQNANDTIQAACPAGTFKAQHNVYYGSASSCSTCATGTFSTGGAKVCTTCPTGYTSAAGATAQNKCYITVEPGKYIATAKTNTKTNCPAGTASEQHNVYYGSTSSCGKCQIGTYSPEGSGKCLACPSGYTSYEGATAENKCYISVEAGKYIGTAKSATKSTCAAGTSKAAHQVYYGSTSSCGTCTAGTYSLAGAGTCTSCPSGYTSDKGATAENKCYINVEAGKYIGTAKTATKSTCAAGTSKAAHQVYYGSTSSCATCTAGTYSLAGAGTCTSCPSGYTSDQGATAQNKCYIKVDAGKYLGTAKGTAQTSCPAGTASLSHNVYYGSTSQCSKCAAGTYSTAGTAICSVCPNGYTSDEGATAQNKCYIKLDNGQYLGTAKSAVKNTCAAGTSKAAHQVYYGSTSSCATCTVGTYSAQGAGSCTDCPSGYTSLAGATAQNKCYINVADGKYLGTAKGTTQTSCAAGKFKSAHQVYYGSTSSCDTCAVGTFSTGGAKICTDCPGSYTSAAGATAEDKCYISVEAGKYIGTAKSSTKTSCAAGTSSSNHTVYYGKTSSCGSCPEGKYSAAGSGTCTSCPTAYPYSAAGSDSIEDCYMKVDNGYYVKAAKDTAATKCSGGYAKGSHTVYYGKTSTCNQCGAGKYSAAGSASCSTCPTAYQYSAAGSDSITDCYMNVGDGYYVKTAKDTAATKCSAGYAKTAHTVYYNSVSSCGICPAGKYSAAGSASCSTCGAGTQSAAGSASCGKCPAGTYSAAGSSSCTSCPNGTYSASGATSCTTCPNGTYNTGTGNSSCSACTAGYKCTTGTREICPAGTYSTGGTTGCTSCPTGYSSPTGSTSASQCTITCTGGYVASSGAACTPCPKGQYKAQHTVANGDTSGCSICPAGQYNTTTGNSSCTTCPAGYSCSGGPNITQCQGGTYSAAGSSSCKQCSAGTYSNAGASSCKQCSAGTFSLAGANICTNCAIGKYSAAGASACESCPVGYTSSGGTTSINGCYMTVGAGKYLATAKASSTSDCPVGTYRAGSETVYYGNISSKCTNCPSGYTSGTGATSQNKCFVSVPAGQRVATSGATPTSCSAGSYSSAHTVNYGSISNCTGCPSGYTSGTGATAQTSCYIDVAAGKYKITSTGTQVNACDAGTYREAHRSYYGSSDYCANCSAGKYSGAGASSCSTCAAGTYNSGTGNTTCSQCPAGSSCSGGTNITQCGAGYYSSSGSSSCKKCPSDYPNSAAGSTLMSNCYMNMSAGYFVPISGNPSTPCGAGLYSNAQRVYYGSQTSCTRCSGGTYSSGGTGSCTSCPSGYTSAAGATSQASCYINVSAGKYLGTAKGTTQTSCAAGKYKAAHTVYYGSTSSCNSCAAGTYSTGGASYCSNCPSGYTSGTGATAQSSCYINVSAGYYKVSSTGSQVNACDGGTYRASHVSYYGSSDYCSNCSAGTYSTGGASSCLTCPSGSTSGAGASSCYPTCTRQESCGCETFSSWSNVGSITKSYSSSQSFPVYSGSYTRYTNCSKGSCTNSSCSYYKYTCTKQTRTCTQYKCC